MAEHEKRKPKILRVITRLERGGVPYEILFLMTDVRLNNLFDQILATGYCKDEVFIPENVRIIRVKNLVRDVSPIKDILAFFELVKIIRRYKPDIVHAHTSKAGLLARFAAFFCGVPKIIYSPHGHIFRGYFSLPKTLFFAFAEFISSFITDFIVVRTQDEEDAFRSIGCRTDFFTIPKSPVPRTQSQIKVVSEKKTADEKNSKSESDERGYKHKKDSDLQEDKLKYVLDYVRKLSRGRYIVGTVSRLEPVKGIEFLILAFDKVVRTIGDSSVFLLIVGDGSKRGELEELANCILPPKSFFFTGWIEPPDIIYPLFDLFVVPSLNEAWGITILEAGRFSIPIIASSVGGIPYFAGGYVKLVPPGNPEKLAEEILKTISNRKVMRELGKKSHELYLKYTPELMIEKYVELYRIVLS